LIIFISVRALIRATDPVRGFFRNRAAANPNYADAPQHYLLSRRQSIQAAIGLKIILSIFKLNILKDDDPDHTRHAAE
jgi:hypothetical protein